jgi:hypothetical protein
MLDYYGGLPDCRRLADAGEHYTSRATNRTVDTPGGQHCDIAIENGYRKRQNTVTIAAAIVCLALS